MKKLSPLIKNSLGFSIVELLVATAIIGTIAAVVLTSRDSYDKSIKATNVATELSLVYREAQSNAVNAKAASVTVGGSSQTVLDLGYGLYFAYDSGTVDDGPIEVREEGGGIEIVEDDGGKGDGGKGEVDGGDGGAIYNFDFTIYKALANANRFFNENIINKTFAADTAPGVARVKINRFYDISNSGTTGFNGLYDSSTDISRDSVFLPKDVKVQSLCYTKTDNVEGCLGINDQLGSASGSQFSLSFVRPNQSPVIYIKNNTTVLRNDYSGSRKDLKNIRIALSYVNTPTDLTYVIINSSGQIVSTKTLPTTVAPPNGGQTSD